MFEQVPTQPQEMGSHQETLVDDKTKEATVPEQVRRAVLFEQTGEQTKEHMREARTAAALESVWRDLRYAVRILVRKPAFTAIAILTLAIGIGANTAIFSVVDAVLLRRLPYPNSDRLTLVWSAFGSEGRSPATGSELTSIRDRSRLFQELAGIWVQSAALTGHGEPEQIKLGWVTSNFLPLLSPRPQLGRFFLPGEQGAGAAPVVILSDGLWRRRYGANPQIIGQPVLLSGRSCTVVGVMPQDFRIAFPEGVSVPASLNAYAPFAWDIAKDPRDQANSYIRVIGRLREGVTIPQAQAEAENIATQLRSEFTEYSEESLRLQVVPLQADVVREVRPALLALFGGVSLVLLITCANIANLLLSRANERYKEITVRTTLGAKPSRIIRQLLAESILLSCLGGIVALWIGWGALKWLVALQPAVVSRVSPIGLNFAVLGFTAIISVGSGILFGLVPALEVTKVNLVAALKEGSRTTTAGKQHSRGILVGCEVALGFVLLIGAGLMMRTFVGLLHVDPGFHPGHVLTFQISLPATRYPKAESAINFVRELQRKLSALPGVQAAGAVSHLPFDDDLPNWYSYFWRQDAPRQMQNTIMADHRSALPGFFESLGVNFVAGRSFDVSDEVANRKVAIVDDTLAEETWPNGDAVGKKLNIENGVGARDVAEVVGVVKHVQYHSLTNQVRPQVYLPYQLAVRPNMSFTVNTKADPRLLVQAIREEVAKLDKDLPVANIRTMDDYVLRAQMATHFLTMLACVLAGIALVLSCIGIYGVTSSWVAHRTNEIGVRMALGAEQMHILKLVVRQNMLPVIWGSLAGLALSLVLTPLLSNLLFGIRPADPDTFAAVSVFLGMTGFLACLLPAYRAARAHPMSALRYE